MNINEKLSSALTIVQAPKSKISVPIFSIEVTTRNNLRDLYPESAPDSQYDVLDSIRNTDIEVHEVNPSLSDNPFAPDPIQFYDTLYPAEQPATTPNQPVDHQSSADERQEEEERNSSPGMDNTGWTDNDGNGVG